MKGLFPASGEQKQVRYAGFHSRLFATLIDLALSMMLMLPLIQISNNFIYGQEAPGRALIPVMQDMHGKVHSVSEGVKLFFSHPQTYHYFIEQYGLLRLGADQLFQLLLFAILFITFWKYKSATPGKMLLSMKIVDAETLEAPRPKQLYIRFFASILSALPFCLGFMWVAFNKKKQAWHDKIAHTVVIKR